MLSINQRIESFEGFKNHLNIMTTVLKCYVKEL